MKLQTIFIMAISVTALLAVGLITSHTNICAFNFLKNKKPEVVLPPKRTDVEIMRQNAKELKGIVDESDPKVALHELLHRMDAEPVVFKNCHELAHQIGHEAIKKYKDFATALRYQDTTCGDGYLHGIMEETFGEKTKDINILISKMQNLCDNMSTLKMRCFHGVGHAMMFYTDSDLPRALKLCGTLDGGLAVGKCYEGAYMQNFIVGSDPSHQSKFVDYSNPMSVCDNTLAKYKPYCYFYVPNFYLDQVNKDYVSAISWCNSAKGGYASTCVRGVGSRTMKYNITDPVFVQNVCKTSQYFADCLGGMVSYSLTFYMHTKPVQEKICDKLDTKYQAMCTSDLTEQTMEL